MKWRQQLQFNVTGYNKIYENLEHLLRQPKYLTAQSFSNKWISAHGAHITKRIRRINTRHVFYGFNSSKVRSSFEDIELPI